MNNTDTSHTSDGETALRATDMLRAVLDRLSAQSGGEGDSGQTKASLGSLVDQLDRRAYGLLLLILALPCCLPFVYILPQIVALPMLVLAGQMALGRSAPWLPEALASREFDVTSLRNVVDRAARYVGWFEALAHPRLTALSGRVALPIVGGLMIIPTASILVPLPLTNTVPGLGVAIAALGLIERDGLLILAGLVMGLAWVALLIFGGQAAVSLLLEMVRSLL